MMEEVLLDVLEDLEEKDFKTFKWRLQKEDSPIPKSKLEKAAQTDTVDLMVQKYECSGAVDVAKKILKKMNRNDLVQHLSNSCIEPKECNSDVGSSSSETPDLPTSRPNDGEASPVSGTSGKAALMDVLSDTDDVADEVLKKMSENDPVQHSSDSSLGLEVCKSSVGFSCSQTPDLPTNKQPDVKASTLSALGSSNSSLRELGLSYNQPRTSGMRLLSDELEDPCWRLDTLRLSGSSDVGLGTTLRSSPSPLRKQDLSVNHAGDSGVKLLSTELDDPHRRLDTLRLEHGGNQRLTSGLMKYNCELPLGAHTYTSYSSPTMTTLKQSFPEMLHRSDLSSNLLRRNY